MILRRNLVRESMLFLILFLALVNFERQLSQGMMVAKEWFKCMQGISLPSLSPHAKSDTQTQAQDSSSFVNATHYSCSIGNETVTVSTNSPNFVIVGTQKGGTSSLFKLLKQHPDIDIGRGPSKIEVHYFDKLQEFRQEREDSMRQQYNISSQQEVYCAYTREYTSHFPQDSSRAAFDKTPSYMYLEEVPDLLLHTCPWKPKILAVLRDPVARAYSHFNMEKNRMYPDKFINKTFESVLEQEEQILKEFGLVPFVDGMSNDEWQRRFYAAQASLSGFTNLNECFRMRSMYWLQLLKWKELFGDHLLVLNYDELYSDKSVVERVFEFIGVPPRRVSGVRANRGAYDEDMSNETRQMLQEFFAPHNAMLARVLGKQWEGVWNYGN